MADHDQTPEDETFDAGFEPPEEPDRVKVGDDLEDPESEGSESRPEDNRTDLTDEERRQLVSLMTLGKRLKTVNILGHEVVLSSLMSEDELLIGDYVRPYMDTLAQARAYQIATVASAVRKVDGEQWGVSLSEHPAPEDGFQLRVDKVKKFHPLVLQYIFNECREIETEFADLARKLGK